MAAFQFFQKFRQRGLSITIANSLDESFILNTDIPVNPKFFRSLTYVSKDPDAYKILSAAIKVKMFSKAIKTLHTQGSLMSDIESVMTKHLNLRYRSAIDYQKLSWIAEGIETFLARDEDEGMLKLWSMTTFSGVIYFERDADKFKFGKMWRGFNESVPTILAGLTDVLK